ncbi:helix-turn-helix transcriptional regulator [Anoxybacillus flavithermus]|uniref:helix-turn-helix transcriptional regulator n=1 Tax=Anoxybacillus flavithermus TaxID=33934 RepID=UPI000B1621DE|nr:helix-turn-helix transcriptional regulator [Anoxybacillus flavithermus]MBE2923942.1 helix-turn-helix transcriptional regulator [Anoxybacillus flavithermus]
MNKEKIAQTLINLRGDRSREEVAKSIGISVSALQMYENGQRIPKDEIKLKIAQYYGVSVETIFFS